MTLQLHLSAWLVNYKLVYIHMPAARVWVKRSTLLNFYLARLLFHWLNTLPCRQHHCANFPHLLLNEKVMIWRKQPNPVTSKMDSLPRRCRAEFDLLLSTTHRNKTLLSADDSSQTFTRCLGTSSKHSKTWFRSDSVFHLN